MSISITQTRRIEHQFTSLQRENTDQMVRYDRMYELEVQLFEHLQECAGDVKLIEKQRAKCHDCGRHFNLDVEHTLQSFRALVSSVDGQEAA